MKSRARYTAVPSEQAKSRALADVVDLVPVCKPAHHKGQLLYTTCIVHIATSSFVIQLVTTKMDDACGRQKESLSQRQHMKRMNGLSLRPLGEIIIQW